MADYGHDPTETSIPWKIFADAGFECTFVTERGTQPACDSRMLTGTVSAVLGAAEPAKAAYRTMSESPAFQHPVAWGDPSFTLDKFDLVFLPGGHDKSIRQILDATRVHKLLADYFALTKKPSTKTLAAICHGVQLLSAATRPDGKSVLADVTTTSLQYFQEESIYAATRVFLGDYYKTYGAGTPSVEQIITSRLDNPSQFQKSLSFAPFVVEDRNYNYLSARFPGDAELIATKTVEAVRKALAML
ncbi:ThiJ/PfpI family protein [Gonapodya prolifera JEL478]|uniref:ThiJ/PfpI family protein n=1 Tax=Gonapodya prolifera (strain JEL478) TaxID=1344416 RepID=A0A139AJR4_GONPJ|nr:ThiJ/PfpI family protein [Gonapodya prolifera JEL478]|eukprot:KXS16999.1 ThiJ/PfpI family protein [Gonapodya prolifera JEL478]